MPQPHDVATRFARGLDEEDYAAVAPCLATACEYEIAGATLRGSEAILASYRTNAEWAARTLDSIQYESRVRPREEGGVVVEFTDHLRHGGESMTHRCEQHLQFDDAGLIARITHVDLPGEPVALTRFFETVGLAEARARRRKG